MKKCEKCKEIKEIVEFHHCSARNDGLQGYCKKCLTEYSKKWIKDHPNIHSERWKKRKKTERYMEQRRKASEKYRKENKEKTNAAVASWLSRNLGKHSERQGLRRANKMMATPSWANRFFIKEIYDLAQRRTKCTGIEWHVDHIVPLKSNLVCGLHVEHNLRVIPGIENQKKQNRYWPDMPVAEFEV